MLTVKELTLIKPRCQKPILQNLNLNFEKGSITFLLGKSGAGKSSLLRCLAQLETDYLGEICFENENLKEFSTEKRARSLSYIAQSYALFPHLSALSNCSQPLRVVNNYVGEESKIKALSILASLGMDSYANSFPYELSGGQQQRVAIARALALNPSVLLFDEPTSALDPENSQQLATILIKLASEGKTMIIASQDMTFVSQLPARVINL